MSDGAGPSTSQQQGKWKKKTKGEKKAEAKRLKEEQKRLKWVEPKEFQKPAGKRDPRPKREAARVDFDGYLRSKNYLTGEVRVIAREASVWSFVSVKEDVCPIPLRLAALDYPKQWFLHEHFLKLKEYIMNQCIQARLLSDPTGPNVHDVLKSDGYALVLAKDEFTAEFVRGLIPVMVDDGMPVKEPTLQEIKVFNSTRGERCDINILIKYRKHGWKRRQAAAKGKTQQGHQVQGEQ